MKDIMNILVLKLTNNEEILAEVLENSEDYEVTNPVGIAIVRGKDGQPNVGFADGYSCRIQIRCNIQYS
jgi:hypothetical protein